MAKSRTIKVDVSPMYRAMIYMVRNEEIPEELINKFTRKGEQLELLQYNSELRTQHWHVYQQIGVRRARDISFNTEAKANEFENQLWHWYGGEEADENDKMPNIKNERCIKPDCRVYVG